MMSIGKTHTLTAVVALLCLLTSAATGAVTDAQLRGNAGERALQDDTNAKIGFGSSESVLSVGRSGGGGGVVTTPGPTPAPTTASPVTDAPVTSAPITPAPVTAAPTTPAPVTAAPVTSAPVTPAPVTAAPTPGPSPAVTPAPTLSPVTNPPTDPPTQTCPSADSQQYWDLEGQGNEGQEVVPCLSNADCADYIPRDAGFACCHWPSCICGAYIPPNFNFALTCLNYEF